MSQQLLDHIEAGLLAPRLVSEAAKAGLDLGVGSRCTAQMTQTDDSLSIAAAAVYLSLSTDTLRYYEKDGLLLQPVRRSASGHRRYGPADLRWILLITRLRASGMAIRDVRRYADLVRTGAGNEQARLALLQEHRRTVLTRLAEVQDHLSAIDHKIGIYTETLEQRGEEALDLERTPRGTVPA